MAQNIKKILLFALCVYLGVAAVLFFIQRDLMYRHGSGIPDRVRSNLAEMEEVRISSYESFGEEGLQLLAWYRAPQKGKPTILYLQGNGGHIGHRPGIARAFLKEGYGFLMLCYRGYCGNKGTPTEQGLIEDSTQAMHWLKQRKETGKIFIYGESIGAAVGVQVANLVAPNGLILYAPFSSMGDEVAHLYPWLPGARYLVRDKWETKEYISKVTAPLLIMHGQADRFVPSWMSAELFKRATAPKELWLDPHSTHYNLWQNGALDKAIEFIEAKR